MRILATWCFIVWAILQGTFGMILQVERCPFPISNLCFFWSIVVSLELPEHLISMLYWFPVTDLPPIPARGNVLQVEMPNCYWICSWNPVVHTPAWRSYGMKIDFHVFCTRLSMLCLWNAKLIELGQICTMVIVLILVDPEGQTAIRIRLGLIIVIQLIKHFFQTAVFFSRISSSVRPCLFRETDLNSYSRININYCTMWAESVLIWNSIYTSKLFWSTLICISLM